MPTFACAIMKLYYVEKLKYCLFLIVLFMISASVFLLILISDEMNKIDKVQSTFWREWKLKLEEKKCAADRSRVLEQIIPGVETARFLSGDVNYIKSVVFTLIDSVKLEKKQILKDLLQLADTYGLNRAEVCGHPSPNS